VDERNKAGEQYSKKIFYTEVEKRNQAQIGRRRWDWTRQQGEKGKKIEVPRYLCR
jgi:hypothetical protein